MKRFYAKELNNLVGKEIILLGWVHNRRDHGGITFFDIRDYTGLIQVVCDPKNYKNNKEVNDIRTEYVVKIKGKVKSRPEKYLNKKIISGKVEVEATEINILNSAKTTPFEINKDTRKIEEETRLKYRYLDLRSQRMSVNLKTRHRVINYIREYLNNKEFIETETPLLTKGTPEGAREYIVPSRLHKGKVFVLPQSPQQYKQLLMVAGFEKYYQIARCLRDEDMRGDRQSEHTQLDFEMSFVTRDNIMQTIETLIINLIKKILPGKKISTTPFSKITYQEAQKKYKTDKPDLRKNTKDPNELAFVWIVDFPLFEKDKNNKLTYSHNPFTAPKPEFENNLNQKKDVDRVISEQYDLVCNGFEIGGGGIRIHDPKLLKKVFEILGHDEKTIQERFGHMFDAFKYGVPPHGGIALGLDRLLMIFQNESNIREVMAFPKTGDARDPLMNAPTTPSTGDLKELGIKFTSK
ncbi:aspartate--tRNA ligase [Patescibacteria group bacterium]